MTAKLKVIDDGASVTVRVPISIRRRGGRKLVLVPEATDRTVREANSRRNDTILKAICRAFRWREMLERGEFDTIAELAIAEKINASYVSRVLRLTLLSPAFVDKILEGRQPANLQLKQLLGRLSPLWSEQGGDLDNRA